MRRVICLLAVLATTGCIDRDDDGFRRKHDCNDGSALAYPGAEEVCDGIDNNCDGQIDVGAVDALTWYADRDGDGFGNPAESVEACSRPLGYVANADDCNDRSAMIGPHVPEICDGIDNDCDGRVDVGAVDAPIWYADQDGDGFGNRDATTRAC